MISALAKIKVCPKCKGTKQYFYDEHHVRPCDACCIHADGWWKLERRYGSDNGKYACKIGCGTLREEPPSDNEMLMAQTREALKEVLGREPTEQEVLRADAGFRRMAMLMYEHINKNEGENKKGH